MFKFLKEKLKSAISSISKKIETKEEVEEIKEKVEQPIEEHKEEQLESIKKEETKEIEEEFKQETPEKKFKFKEIGEIEKEVGIKDVEVDKPKKERKSFFKRLFRKEVTEEEPKLEEIKETPKVEELKETKVEHLEEKKTEKPKEEIKEEVKEHKGIFQKIKEKITTKKISEQEFEELFNDLEIVLLENNVAYEVIVKIKEDLRTSLVDKPIKRSEVELSIKNALKLSISEVLEFEKLDLINLIKDKREKPYVIVFFGINGSGKTTTIAKIAHLLQKSNLSIVLAASDTFRAASIEQLQQHADKLNIKLIKHNYGSDPAAVAFDAIKHAQAKSIDVVLVDTAGRLHSNTNLMDEMKKIVKVTKPDLKIFVGESITGNDCVEQCNTFNENIGIDAIILTKADVDEKGGTAISISYVTKKPILYLGMGQGYDSLEEFNSEKIVASIGL